MANQEPARRLAIALDHLGHTQPVVRAGGFAELDRLAADDPSYAQAVADVVCTYLRLPFDPPPYCASPAYLSPALSGDLPVSKLPGFPELQVRLAAQAVLTRRLLPEMAQQTDQDDGSPPGVPDLLIDLSGATLVNISFAHRRLHAVRFTYATFHDEADFNGAAFTGGTWFGKASFHGPAWFQKTRFQDAAIFANAKFIGFANLSVTFDKAHFHDHTSFTSAEFKNEVDFNHATFHASAGFTDIRCEELAEFRGVTFKEPTFFDRASFAMHPDFDGQNNIRGDPTVAGQPRHWPDDLRLG